MISIKNKDKLKPSLLKEISKDLDKLIGEEPGQLVKYKYSHKKVREVINKLYHDKCAYCEGKIPESYTERIDHYRPKNKIKTLLKNKNGKIIYIDKKRKVLSVPIDSKQPRHKGYYWLGYEWTNLLPTCEKCNSIKSNLFPLKDETKRLSDDINKEGFRVNGKYLFDTFKINSAILQREERLLLNPELDQVEEHFIFLPTGEIYSETVEGKMSIEVYGLNRNSLIITRRKIIDELIKELIEIMERYQNPRERIQEFFDRKVVSKRTKEYSRFRFFIDTYFKEFVEEPFIKLME